MTPQAKHNAKARKRLTEAGGKRIDVVLSKIGLYALSELQGETNENISLTVEMALQSALERCRETPTSIQRVHLDGDEVKVEYIDPNTVWIHPSDRDATKP